MDLEKMTKDLALQVIAAEIIKGIDTESRNAILSTSIQNAMKDWQFKSAIEKAVAAKAELVAAEMLVTEEWGSQITKSIQTALSEMLDILPALVQRVFADALFGKEDSSAYSRAPSPIRHQLEGLLRRSNYSKEGKE